MPNKFLVMIDRVSPSDAPMYYQSALLPANKSGPPMGVRRYKTPTECAAALRNYFGLSDGEIAQFLDRSTKIPI